MTDCFARWTMFVPWRPCVRYGVSLITLTSVVFMLLIYGRVSYHTQRTQSAVLSASLPHSKTREMLSPDTTPSSVGGVPPKPEMEIYTGFQAALEKVADKNKTVLISIIDSGYINTGINFYLTSLKKFDIRNFLYVCFNEGVKAALLQHGISCFVGASDKDSTHASAYRSRAFQRKTVFKLHKTLEALKLGYTVLVVDLDLIFMKNPLLYLPCADCDLQYQKNAPGNNGLEVNTGFMLVRPTPASIGLYEAAIVQAKKTSKDDQDSLKVPLQKLKRSKSIKAVGLDERLFLRGNDFFEQGHRMFHGDNPCAECVMVHNNWIVGVPAKEYRFKEMLMWHFDNNKYYSDDQAKYITYANPVSSLGWKKELQALRNALHIAHILNRTLVLPDFTCQGSSIKQRHCPLNAHLGIQHFDQYLAGTYREHVFFKHPMVPNNILKSTSDTFLIEFGQNENSSTTYNKTQEKVKLVTPKNLQSGPTGGELIEWFGNDSHSILQFHSLYGSIKNIKTTDAAFDELLDKALKPCDYRHLCYMGT